MLWLIVAHSHPQAWHLLTWRGGQSKDLVCLLAFLWPSEHDPPSSRCICLRLFAGAHSISIADTSDHLTEPPSRTLELT
eukprot:scaffold1265_cov366-Prasinococcus_capsulatus_cf.AAC.26